MKKKLAAILLVTALALTGCASGSGSEAAVSATESAEDGEVVADTELEEGDVEVEAEGDPVDDSVTADEAPVADGEMTADNIADYLDLAEYKGLEIEAPEGTAIEKGMIAAIDYAGKVDGKAFDGGTGSYNLEIGSGSFIDTFEDQLIGHKAGETLDVNVTFPQDYGVEDLNGKPAVFEVTVKNVYHTIPEVAFQKLVDASTVKQYPKDMVTAWEESFIDQYGSYVTSSREEVGTDESQADSDGEDEASEAESTSEAAGGEVTLADLAEVFNMTEQSLRNMIYTNVKGDMVARAILWSEGITSESEEYMETLNSVLAENGFESVEAALNNGAPEIEVYYVGDVQHAQKILIQYEKK